MHSIRVLVARSALGLLQRASAVSVAVADVIDADWMLITYELNIIIISIYMYSFYYYN